MKKLIPLAASALLAACATTSQPAAAPPVTVQVLGLNDFHGALEPPNQSVTIVRSEEDIVRIPAGGAAWLASALTTLRSQHAHSITVAAGDMTGASQLASALYLDEPSVRVLSELGVELNAVGNHEFDRGWRELKRLQEGGCEKLSERDPCKLEPFEGASFAYLAANVIMPDGSTLFPATALRSFGEGESQVTLGFVGLTLQDTDKLVAPAGIEGIRFGDEVEAINRGVASLDAEGADAIVVLIHQGIKTFAAPDPNGCGEPTGPLERIMQGIDPRVDVIVSGHTHWAYVCEWPSSDPGHMFLLTSAGVFGALVSDITLEIDPASGEVISKSANNVVVQSRPYRSSVRYVENTDLYPRFEPDPGIETYIAQYVEAAEAFTQRPIGRVSRRADKGEGAESNRGKELGRLIADAQLAATREAGAQIALMNPFGIRAPLQPAEDGTLTYGDIARTQPFNNTLVTQNFTGAQLKRVLEQQFEGEDPEQFLSPSAGFAYTFDRSRPVGDRIVAMTLDGVPIEPDAIYRVTTNSFLASGGDSFAALTEGTQAVEQGTDIDALEAYIRAVPVREVPFQDGVIEASAD
ncbi:bifunctional metallophosphatase/5'-nucleotidase [Altererythrobacter sp. GH1-8]|uniref:bifunctional metallophosphatase/5'-nucleotidase n=1 Tax=Altererythrobacter sp. GH1-8 TaxID=3349333 RepID=UPI00374CE2BF